MFNYSLGLVPDVPYAFRSGGRVRIGRGVDHVPLIEIFLREEYGRLPDGATVLDLGANIGAFSVYAATTARDLRILAYEPMPEFFQLLQENVRLNDVARQVTCFNLAVAGRPGPRTFVVEGAGVLFPTLVLPPGPGVERTATVACTTLAEICDANGLRRVDVLKMDCEGAEYEILYETPASCFERLKEIRMEYHDAGAPPRDLGSLTAFLRGRGYEVVLSRATGPANGTLWVRRRD
jgi:FkbM family methyltransferase